MQKVKKQILTKNIIIWWTGLITLFFIEAGIRITMNAPYFLTMQTVTLLVYAAVGFVSGLLFGIIILSMRSIFPEIKTSYSCVSMSAFITGVLSSSLFLYLFKGKEVLGSSSYTVNMVLILCLSIASIFALYFFFRWNELRDKLFISYFSILPPLWLITSLAFLQDKRTLPALLIITDLFHWITLLIISSICFFLLYVLLPVCSRFIERWKRRHLLKAGLIMVPLIVVVLVFIFPQIGQKQQSKPNEIKKTPGTLPNIVLITMDTTRADHLSCYGYRRLTTPHVDQLAREGVLYKNAYATAPWTLASHASIFTGMYPSKHGADFSEDLNEQTGQKFSLREMMNKSISKLSDHNITLAELLSEKGYRTAGIIGGIFTSSIFGIAQGFEYYNESFFNYDKDIHCYFLYRVTECFYSLQDRIIQYGYADAKRVASQLNEVAFEWLKGNGSQPFFLFINYFDAHSPYLPPPPYDEYFKKMSPDIILKRNSKFEKSYVAAWMKLVNAVCYNAHELTPEEREFLVSRYDAEIHYLDHYLGLLFERLKALKVYDNTLIIVTADHGEAFGEHNLIEHMRTLYNELLRVPLIIKYPATCKQHAIIEKQVSLVDLFPTILSIVNEPIPAGIDGQTLTESQHLIVAEWHMRWYDPEQYQRNLKAIYQGKEKFIWASNSLHELYDLEKDPGETVNLFKEFPQRANSMEKTLNQWLSSFKPPDTRGEKVKLDESTVEKLQALGYIK